MTPKWRVIAAAGWLVAGLELLVIDAPRAATVVALTPASLFAVAALRGDRGRLSRRSPPGAALAS